MLRGQVLVDSEDLVGTAVFLAARASDYVTGQCIYVDGDDWRFDFPFTLAKGDALGSCAYLHRVFSSYGEGSVGDFMTEGVDFHLEQGGAQPVYLLELMVWLAPYDLGVSQRVFLRTLPTDDIPGIYRIEMHLQRVSGDVVSWQRLNTSFLNVLRKRFLVWRTIAPEVREEYLIEGEKLAQGTGMEQPQISDIS